MRSLLIIGLASALGTGASSQTSIPTHTITLYSYGYAPATIRLRAGQPVVLNFVNRARNSHDFTAPAFFARSRILSGPVQGGEVALRGRQSVSVSLVPARGTYRVHCGHFLHKQLGMRGTIAVT